MFICVGNFNFLTEFSITEINQLRFRVILQVTFNEIDTLFHFAYDSMKHIN